MSSDATPCQQPGADPEDWFAPVGSTRESHARLRCVNDCPLFHQCREEALRIGVPYGTWGGMDERTRQRVWARTPGGRPTLFDDGVQSVRRFLDVRVEAKEGAA